MAHIRTQIRAAVVELIKGSSLIGNRVGGAKVTPVKRDASPHCFVSTPNEQSNDQSTEGTQLRVLRLKIDAVMKGDVQDAQDDLDGFALFVEQAMADDAQIGGLATATEYRGTSFNYNADGDNPFTVMSITYDVALLTSNSDPETAL